MLGSEVTLRRVEHVSEQQLSRQRIAVHHQIEDKRYPILDAPVHVLVRGVDGDGEVAGTEGEHDHVVGTNAREMRACLGHGQHARVVSEHGAVHVASMGREVGWGRRGAEGGIPAVHVQLRLDHTVHLRDVREHRRSPASVVADERAHRPNLAIQLERGHHHMLLQVTERAILAEVCPAQILAALGAELGLERVVDAPRVFGENERAAVLVDRLALSRGVARSKHQRNQSSSAGSSDEIDVVEEGRDSLDDAAENHCRQHPAHSTTVEGKDPELWQVAVRLCPRVLGRSRAGVLDEGNDSWRRLPSLGLLCRLLLGLVFDPHLVPQLVVGQPQHLLDPAVPAAVEVEQLVPGLPPLLERLQHAAGDLGNNRLRQLVGPDARFGSRFHPRRRHVVPRRVEELDDEHLVHAKRGVPKNVVERVQELQPPHSHRAVLFLLRVDFQTRGHAVRHVFPEQTVALRLPQRLPEAEVRLALACRIPRLRLIQHLRRLVVQVHDVARVPVPRAHHLGHPRQRPCPSDPPPLPPFLVRLEGRIQRDLGLAHDVLEQRVLFLRLPALPLRALKLSAPRAPQPPARFRLLLFGFLVSFRARGFGAAFLGVLLGALFLASFRVAWRARGGRREANAGQRRVQDREHFLPILSLTQGRFVDANDGVGPFPRQSHRRILTSGPVAGIADTLAEACNLLLEVGEAHGSIRKVHARLVDLRPQHLHLLRLLLRGLTRSILCSCSVLGVVSAACFRGRTLDVSGIVFFLV
mmetsp:Transcript_37506/g.88259  ORF Transcript_37506/g.88259 Transcript_37506/m.88259 type:complete len:753 (-) Transcript_37506:819-3077(-)